MVSPATSCGGFYKLLLIAYPCYAKNGGRYMDLTEDEIEAANRRGVAMLARYPAAVAVHYDCDSACIVISLSNGRKISVSPQEIPGMELTSPEDLNDAEISPQGQGIHFPVIDADIFIPALLDGLGSHQ
jgi:hypothetical protein